LPLTTDLLLPRRCRLRLLPLTTDLLLPRRCRLPL